MIFANWQKNYKKLKTTTSCTCYTRGVAFTNLLETLVPKWILLSSHYIVVDLEIGVGTNKLSFLKIVEVFLLDIIPSQNFKLC